MRARGLLATAAMSLALVVAHTTAKAEPMDPALERLVLNPGCHQSSLPNGQVGNSGVWRPIGGAGAYGRCLPDNVAFKRLVNQYGFALAPTAMHPARTTGFAGIELSLEGSFTTLDNNALYMQYGTRGPIDENTNRASVKNKNPDSVAQVYYLKGRKGFPFGLEITGLVGTMSHTSFVILGSDVRMALLEGFRKGALGYIPDMAIGAGVRTITGTPQLQLTTVGVDGQLSKPITLGDMSRLTPYIGYQYLWIFGDSGLIDTTPATDAVGLCGYAGPNIPGTPDRPSQVEITDSKGNKKVVDAPYDGQPVCKGGTPLDFNNTVVFDAVRLHRQRLIFGATYRWKMVSFGLQYLTELGDSASTNKDDDLQGVPKQSTFSFNIGGIF